jgi:folate-binding protein YgfZ
MGTWFGCSLPTRFSDAPREYRYARETVALVDKNYRAFLEFTGPDRARYLNAVLTNNVRDLKTGDANVSLLLNAQGHILAEVETYALADRILLVSYAMIRERLVTTLEKYIIMDDVALEEVSDRYAVVALEGPRTGAVVGALGGPALESLAELGHTEISVAGMACRMVRRSPGGVPGCEFIVERSRAGELWKMLAEAVRARGGGAIGYEALSVLRLEAGIPWFGYDFDEKQIPHEAGLENTHISYTKGCYTGQEIVERVRSRGHVNRMLVGLKFSGEEPPAADTPLRAGDAEVGRVTRAGYSPALGCAIGMGYVRRENNSVGSELQWAAGTAQVIELPQAK